MSVSPIPARWPALCMPHAGSYKESGHQFKFLGLPPEIRYMIYEYAVPRYSSINDTIARHVAKTLENEHWEDPRNLQHYYPPKVVKITPSIFLVCRQIYNELQASFAKETLYLDHGLMNFKLNKLISTPSLRNVTSLILSHHGHAIMNPRLRMSFIGHQRLALSLAGEFKRAGHKLQYLELNFDSHQLEYHAHHCMGPPQPGGQSCDMKPWLEKIVNAWCMVRGIKTVKINGWLPQPMKDKMLRLMQAKPAPLLRLPEPILARIASYVQPLASISRAINLRNVPDVQTAPDSDGDVSMGESDAVNVSSIVPLCCPGVLAVDRVHHDILLRPFLGHPLELDLIGFPTNEEVIEIENFVVHEPLINVTGLVVRIRHRAWLALVASLARCAWDNEQLTHVHIHLEDGKRNPDPNADYPDRQLASMLDHLRYFSKVPKVTWGGDLAHPVGEGAAYLADLAKQLGGTNDIEDVERELMYKPDRACPFRGGERPGAWRSVEEMVNMPIDE